MYMKYNCITINLEVNVYNEYLKLVLLLNNVNKSNLQLSDIISQQLNNDNNLKSLKKSIRLLTKFSKGR